MKLQDVKNKFPGYEVFSSGRDYFVFEKGDLYLLIDKTMAERLGMVELKKHVDRCFKRGIDRDAAKK